MRLDETTRNFLKYLFCFRLQIKIAIKINSRASDGDTQMRRLLRLGNTGSDQLVTTHNSDTTHDSCQGLSQSVARTGGSDFTIRPA